MAGPIPLLQFNPYNPMQTALEAALGTHRGLGQGRAQQIQNQLQGARVPFAGQIAEEELLAQQLQNQLQGFGVQQKQAEAPYYGELAALAPEQARNDIAYKEAMAQSAQQNAITAALETKLKQARNPLEMEQISIALEQAKAQKEWDDYFRSVGAYTPEQKNIAAIQRQRQMGMQEQQRQPEQMQPDVNQPEYFSYLSSLPATNEFAQDRYLKSALDQMYMTEPEKAAYSKKLEQKAVQEEKMFAETTENLFKDAEAVSQARTNIKRAVDAYDKLALYEKGVFGDVNPKYLSENAQIVDNATRNLQKQLIETLRGTGAVSEGDLKLLEAMLPTRKMNKEAFMNVADYMTALQNRVEQRVGFFEEGWKRGMDTSQIKKDWAKYNTKNSLNNDLEVMKLERLMSERMAEGIE